jgi:H+/Cl- antiporter ClcA
MSWIVGVAVLGGLAAAMFAKLCDGAMLAHTRLMAFSPWMLLLLPIGFPVLTWITHRFAPEASSSGIPQVIAAAESRWSGRWGGQRVTLRTAAWKVVLTAGVLLCGGSIGREGPTVQVVAGIVRTLTRGLKGGPGRRAVIIAGGAAGVSAAFNTPIAGVVFAVEELARGFDKRTNTTVILVVVAAGFASYALQGDYAYFGHFQASTSADHRRHGGSVRRPVRPGAGGDDRAGAGGGGALAAGAAGTVRVLLRRRGGGGGAGLWWADLRRGL